MNLSSASTSYLTGKNNNALGSQSEKFLSSPSRRSLSPSGSPYGKRLDTLKHTMTTSDSIGDVYSYEKIVNSITELSEKNRKQIEERIQACADQCTSAEGKIAKDSEALQKLDKRRIDEFVEVENNLIDQINAETKKIRDSRAGAIKTMEERTVALKADVVKTKRQMDDHFKVTVKKLDDKVHSLHENLAEMIRIRKEGNDKLVNNLSGRLQKIEETLKSEKKIREKLEDTFLRSVEEWNKSLSVQVEAEKQRREKAENQMLNLLDEATVKLEKHQMQRRARY